MNVRLHGIALLLTMRKYYAIEREIYARAVQKKLVHSTKGEQILQDCILEGELAYSPENAKYLTD